MSNSASSPRRNERHIATRRMLLTLNKLDVISVTVYLNLLRNLWYNPSFIQRLSKIRE